MLPFGHFIIYSDSTKLSFRSVLKDTGTASAAQPVLLRCDGIDFPDFAAVVADATLGGEVAEAGDIEDGGARPVLGVEIRRADLGLASGENKVVRDRICPPRFGPLFRAANLANG